MKKPAVAAGCMSAFVSLLTATMLAAADSFEADALAVAWKTVLKAPVPSCFPSSHASARLPAAASGHGGAGGGVRTALCAQPMGPAAVPRERRHYYQIDAVQGGSV